MNPDYRALAEWLEEYVDAPKDVDIGFYDGHGALTPAGLLCFVLYLLRNSVFDNEREMAVIYARETGRLMPVVDITSLVLAGDRKDGIDNG